MTNDEREQIQRPIQSKRRAIQRNPRHYRQLSFVFFQKTKTNSKKKKKKKKKKKATEGLETSAARIPQVQRRKDFLMATAKSICFGARRGGGLRVLRPSSGPPPPDRADNERGALIGGARTTGLFYRAVSSFPFFIIKLIEYFFLLRPCLHNCTSDQRFGLG